jgi:hypothetical protein
LPTKIPKYFQKMAHNVLAVYALQAAHKAMRSIAAACNVAE